MTVTELILYILLPLAILIPLGILVFGYGVPVAVRAIRWLLRQLGSRTLWPFILYRLLIAGLLVAGLVAAGGQASVTAAGR